MLHTWEFLIQLRPLSAEPVNIVGVVGAVVVLSLLAVLTVTGVVLYYNPLLCLRGRAWFLLPGALSLTCLSLPVCWSQSGLPVPHLGRSPPHLCLCLGLPVTIWGRHRIGRGCPVQ